MTDIPDDPVRRGVEDREYRDRKLHYAEAGCEMASVAADDLDDPLPHLGREEHPPVDVQGGHVGRGTYSFQQAHQLLLQGR